MANTVQLTKNGQPVFPVTDVSLVMGLQDAIKLPPVKVATLPTASADTAGKMYYVGPTDGEYERYITSAVNGSYEWIDLGDTAIPLPSIADNLTTNDPQTALSAAQGVVLDGKVSQLGQKVNGLEITASVVPGSYTNIILSDYGIAGGDTINVTNSGAATLGIEIRDANNTATIVNETVATGTNRNITLPSNAGRLRMYSSASLTATIKTNGGLKKDVAELQSLVSQNAQDIENLDLAVNGASADVVVVPNSYTNVQLADLKSSAGHSLHFVNSGTTNVSVEFRDSGNTTTLLSNVIPNGGELDVTIPSGASFIRMGSSRNAPVKVIAAEGLEDKLESFVSAETILTKSFNSSFHIGAENWEGKAKEYTDLFNDSDENEAFLFFTDPHFFTRDDNIWKKMMPEFIAEIQKYYNSTPASFCISGGDWLTAQDSNDVAKFRLGYIDGIMNSMFKEYYPVFGNHDDNYQGASEDGGEAATGTPLPKQTIVNLWFRNFKKAYYDFTGMASHIYVFDTGNDWQTQMNDYRWEQVDWFGKSLTEKDDSHIIIVVHIAYNSASDVTSNILFPMTDNIAQLAQAYNNRATITLNGIAYDFRNAKGKVEFILAGHMHEDITSEKYGLPIICTINAMTITTEPSFDLMFVDYNARLVNCIRVGSGNNRQIALQ